MMGSGGRGVSICFTTLRACRLQVRDSQRDRLAHRPHGNDPVRPLGRVRGVGSLLRFRPPRRRTPGSLPKRNSVPSLHMRCRMTASLRATATRARAMPRRLAIFMPQARRLDHLRAAHQQRMGRLVERGAGELVAAAADPALDVGLAGLVARAASGRDARRRRATRRKRSGRSMVARKASAVIGPTPGTLISRRQTSSPRDDVEHLLGQAGELVQHRGEDRQQRLDERASAAASSPASSRTRAGEGRAARRAELEAGLAQHRPHPVLDRSRISLSTVRRATSSARQSRH